MSALSVNTPVARQIGNHQWLLLEPYEAEFELQPRHDCILAGTYQVRVEDGFVWRPSAPKWSWAVTPPHQLHTAALVHDWMYRWKGDLWKYGEMREINGSGNIPIRTVTRKEADIIFRELLRRTAVPKWRRDAAYWGVRLGGKGKWKDPPKETMQEKRDRLTQNV